MRPGLLIDHDLARYRYPAFAAPAEPTPVPEHIDLRAELLAANDQGNTPRCAAYAMAGVVEWYNWKHRGRHAQMDPAPIYELAKKLDGHPREDGTTLEAVATAATQLGLLPIDLLSLRVVPVPEAKRALHRHGAFLAGFLIDDGWPKAQPDGWIPEGKTHLGGHAVVLAGYSEVETPPWFGIQNSWGEGGYGWRGFCRLTPGQFTSQFMYGLVWDYL